jgi:proteasome lid subunit RPN8/RPN11
MEQRQSQHLALSNTAQQTILADITQRPQIEACGVLLGTIDQAGNWNVEQAYPLINSAASPVYFEFEPAELLQVELSYPEQIVGVYHSHPTGFPQASKTDRDNMQRVNLQQSIPWVWLIISGPFDAKFRHKAQGELSTAPLIAYHHFATGGLQQVPLCLGDSKNG